MFFFARSSYCGYCLTSSGWNCYSDRKLFFSQKKIWAKSKNRQMQKQKFVLLCGRNIRSCHWEVFCKMMFFFIRSFYCGYGLTSSGRKYYHDRKLLISQKKIWGKSINWQMWKQKFVLLCGWKTCGSKIKSTKANNIWNKIKAEVKKHSTAKTAK